jgi:hypothetical protein
MMKPVRALFTAGLALVLLAAPAISEDWKDDERKGEVPRPGKSAELAAGFYYAALFQAAQFGGGWGGFFGQRAALVVNRVIAIGGGCELSMSADRGRLDAGGNLAGVYLQLPYPPDPAPRILYGGGYFSYHFLSESIASFSVGALIGGGHLGRNYAGGPGCDYFVFEPEAYVYVNLPKYVRLGAGLSYRVSWGLSYQGITDMDFRGLSIGVQAQAGLL